MGHLYPDHPRYVLKKTCTTVQLTIIPNIRTNSTFLSENTEQTSGYVMQIPLGTNIIRRKLGWVSEPLACFFFPALLSNIATMDAHGISMSMLV